MKHLLMICAAISVLGCGRIAVEDYTVGSEIIVVEVPDAGQPPGLGQPCNGIDDCVVGLACGIDNNCILCSLTTCVQSTDCCPSLFCTLAGVCEYAVD